MKKILKALTILAVVLSLTGCSFGDTGLPRDIQEAVEAAFWMGQVNAMRGNYYIDSSYNWIPSKTIYGDEPWRYEFVYGKSELGQKMRVKEAAGELGNIK